MQISLEAAQQHAVQAYDEHQNQIQINSVIYGASLIVSRTEIISDLTIKTIKEIDEHLLHLLIQSKPELILIGHGQAGAFPPMTLLSQLSKMRIGFECMTLGAACRTFNVLLSEDRAVVAGFIL